MAHKQKWTQAEENRVKQQVMAYPQNLKRCFMIVAEEIDRTEGAVANRWYGKLSKEPGVDNFAFGTISQNSFSKNRKNGEGTPITPSLWNRFVRLVRNFL